MDVVMKEEITSGHPHRSAYGQPPCATLRATCTGPVDDDETLLTNFLRTSSPRLDFLTNFQRVFQCIMDRSTHYNA
jgi:hypothetical protein